MSNAEVEMAWFWLTIEQYGLIMREQGRHEEASHCFYFADWFVTEHAGFEDKWEGKKSFMKLADFTPPPIPEHCYRTSVLAEMILNVIRHGSDKHNFRVISAILEKWSNKLTLDDVDSIGEWYKSNFAEVISVN